MRKIHMNLNINKTLDPKAFIEYSNDTQDVYKSIE